MQITKPVFLKKFSPKLYWKEILAVLIILLAYVFFRSERHEMSGIGPQLAVADPLWIGLGICVTLLYIFLQGMMYVESFKAIGLKLKIRQAVSLFLKRNFLSVFLPAGGVTSLAYQPQELKRKSYDSVSIHQSGVIYGFVGLLTAFVVGIPVVTYSLIKNQHLGNAWMGLFGLGLVLMLMFSFYKDLQKKGFIFRLLDRKFPAATLYLKNIFSAELKKAHFYRVVFYSVLIEFTGFFMFSLQWPHWALRHLSPQQRLAIHFLFY